MSMYRFRDTSLTVRAWPLRRLYLFLGVGLLIPCLALALLAPAEISLLVYPDGRVQWFFNRQFDLPTGDPASFHDYSLMPLFCAFFGCGFFYLLARRILLKLAD